MKSLTTCCTLGTKKGKRICCSNPATRWYIIENETLAAFCVAFCVKHGGEVPPYLASEIQEISYKEAVIWQIMQS